MQYSGHNDKYFHPSKEARVQRWFSLQNGARGSGWAWYQTLR